MNEELAKKILEKYGEEEGRQILTKLMAVEQAGGDKFFKQGLEKLRQALPEEKQVIKGVTDHIKTKEAQKLLSGDEFMKKIAQSRAAKRMGKGALKSIPLVGGLAAALATEDANAAVPILSEAEALGPQKGDEGYDIENPPADPKEHFKNLKKYMK